MNFNANLQNNCVNFRFASPFEDGNVHNFQVAVECFLQYTQDLAQEGLVVGNLEASRQEFADDVHHSVIDARLVNDSAEGVEDRLPARISA